MYMIPMQLVCCLCASLQLSTSASDEGLRCFPQTESSVAIFDIKPSMFNMSNPCYMIFMDRISKRSYGLESVRFGDIQVVSLLFPDYLVLRIMKISTTESETIILS